MVRKSYCTPLSEVWECDKFINYVSLLPFLSSVSLRGDTHPLLCGGHGAKAGRGILNLLSRHPTPTGGISDSVEWSAAGVGSLGAQRHCSRTIRATLAGPGDSDWAG